MATLTELYKYLETRNEVDHLESVFPYNEFSQEEQQPIGKYGRMRRSYLKENRPVIYCNLILSGKLYQHLSEINQRCLERMELLVQRTAKREGVTETLKAVDQMAWVGKMNSIHSRAEAIVLHDLVYTEEAEYAGS